MAATLQIPIFPLGTVLYPEGVLPLRIFEQRYLDMTKVCIRDESPFGVCLIRDGLEVGAPAIPCDTGCTAQIKQWDMPHLGLFHLETRGAAVFRILEQWHTKNGLIQAQVEVCDAPAPLPLPDEFGELVELLQKIMRKVGAERFAAPVRLDDAQWVGFRLAEILPLEVPVKQQLLEARDPLATLQEVRAFLETRDVVL